MRRLVLLVLVVLLGPAVAVGGWSASAQEIKSFQECAPGVAPPQLGLREDQSYFWEGVCRPIPPDERAPVPFGSDLMMQPYAVYFTQDFAAVPDAVSGDFYPPFMVVVVQEGTFALDVKRDTPGRVVVYGAGNEIPLLTGFEDIEPFYRESSSREVLTDSQGNPCLRACEVPNGTVVQLGAGDRIVAEEGAICVYCLLDTNRARGDETGLLEVFALRKAGEDPFSFNWIKSWDRAQRGELPLEPTETSSSAQGWAFFDPGTRCKDG